MGRHRRVGRWALVAVVVLVAGWVLLRVGAGVYLRTAAGRSAVAHQLQDMIGLPVEVAEVDLGSRSSIKFRVLEPAAGPSPPREVLSVESATADVSLTDVLTRSVAPREVDLRGVSLTLRLDADGRVLTTMPNAPSGGGGGPPPRVTVQAARVHIKQEGRPDFDLSGISLKAEPAGDKLTISGAVDDPGWGKWRIAGEVDTAAKTGWVEITTADAVLDADRLRTIPYIPLAVWDQVRPAGKATAKIRLAVGPDRKFDYDAEVKPQDATITVPEADTTVTNVNGAVRFRDARLQVDGCAGRLAGGTVGVSGSADFGPEPTAVKLRATADNLAVRQLPATWDLATLGGRLSGKVDLNDGFLNGQANLELRIHKDGRVENHGSGRGSIVLPSFLGGSARIGVVLRGTGDGYRWDHQPQPTPPDTPGGSSRLETNPWRGRRGGDSVSGAGRATPPHPDLLPLRRGRGSETPTRRPGDGRRPCRPSRRSIPTGPSDDSGPGRRRAG
jgi:hypothetical protein